MYIILLSTSVQDYTLARFFSITLSILFCALSFRKQTFLKLIKYIMSYSQEGEASNSTPAPQAEVYDTTRFGELYYGSRQPEINELGLAARFMIQVFEHYRIPFAFLGGWAMYMRGSRRQTQDVDIAVGTTMEYLKAILLQCSR
jgi:hypothetical protein